jgi:V8-like Glu-specific endopeptidase
LLADTSASNTPHFLTANHCISTQTVASSLETYWFWRSAACNSTSINPGWIGRHGGATYVWGRYYISAGTTNSYNPTGTDTSFLKLNDAPPAGAMFAGWTANPQAVSTTNYVGIHNPKGDWTKRSDGNINGYTINLADGQYSSSTIDTLPRYRVSWTSGVTEGGSSGSPLFLNGTGSNPQVIGQLYGGASSCSNPTGSDSYGRFDIAYNLALSDWLSQGAKRVSRFYNSASGTHFYSMSASESTYIKDTFPTFSFEGLPFGASSVSSAGLNPVHRFYNLSLGVHFYTISESERAFVAANLPQMRYEGIAWYANNTNVAGTVPLYRFYNRDKGVHFYTVSAAERASVIANLPQMNNEGIAYYVLP